MPSYSTRPLSAWEKDDPSLGYTPTLEEDGWSRTTKAAVVVIVLLAAAYGAHRYGLVDLSKPAGAVGDILSRGMDYGKIGADYVKSAYNFTASYTPDLVKQGMYYGSFLAVTLITTSCIMRMANLIIACEQVYVNVHMPSINLQELGADLGRVNIRFR